MVLVVYKRLPYFHTIDDFRQERQPAEDGDGGIRGQAN